MKTVQKLLPSRFRRSAKLATQSARTNQDSSQGNLQHPSAEPRSRSVCEPDRACPPVEANETSEERELQDTHDPDSANDTREARGQRCHNEQGNRYGDIYIYGTHARAVLGNVIGNLENAQAPHPDDDLKLVLKALYYESMNSRKNAIISADEETCQWVWETPFSQWACDARAQIFWIIGKPGSGKSTLMKYLSQCSALKAHLPEHTGGWAIVSFFFDFRLMNETGNSVQGLLRSLLYQILEHAPPVLEAGVFVDLKSTGVTAASLSVDHLASSLEKVLESVAIKFLILIDGLDEFAGSMRLLLQVLLKIKHPDRWKLCLASRPHSMITQVLGDKTPTLQMSDHNADGIRLYITNAIEHFKPLLDTLRLQHIQDLIQTRAEGVFLWVFLVVEEILQACVDGASASEVVQKLNVLPSEIEALYQRIVDRISSDRREEAAIVHAIVCAADFPVSVSLLETTLRFVISLLGLTDFLAGIHHTEHFVRRLQTTMGGLLEVAAADQEDTSDRDSVLSGYQHPRKYVLQALPGTNDTTTPTLYVRSIHETARSFADRSHWSDTLLPPAFKQAYSTNFWLKMTSQAWLLADVLREPSVLSILQHIEWQQAITAAHEVQLLYGQDMYEAFVELIGKRPDEAILTRLLPLITESVQIGDTEDARAWLWSSDGSSSHDSEVRKLQDAIRCRMAVCSASASAHDILNQIDDPDLPDLDVLSINAEPARVAEEDEIGDLMLVAGHRGYRYIRENYDRVKRLTDCQRDNLATMLLFSSRRPRPFLDEEHKSVDTTSVHNLVDDILCYNHDFGVFHLAIYLLLGYREVPRFMKMMQERLIMDPVHHNWRGLQRMRWETASLDLRLPEEHPLFIWAHDWQREYSQQSADVAHQLDVILALPTDINSPRSSYDSNIVHYIIATHVAEQYERLKHSLDGDIVGNIQNGLVKLYIVEARGADFTARSIYGTPLQTFREHAAIWFASEKSNWGPIQAHLHAFGLALEHKEIHGYLPHRAANSPNRVRESRSGKFWLWGPREESSGQEALPPRPNNRLLDPAYHQQVLFWDISRSSPTGEKMLSSQDAIDNDASYLLPVSIDEIERRSRSA